MERIIVRFLSGARANQEIAFSSAELNNGLIAGRDPACRVVFDPTDDSVSRQHMRIVADSTRADGLKAVDLNSANGVYINGARVTGEQRIEHGDIVRFGHGGPEISIHFDPAPPASLKATRVINMASDVGATREVRMDAGAGAASETFSAPPAAEPAEAGNKIGRATVERLITEERSSSKKRIVQVGVLGIAVAALLGGYQYYEKIKADEQMAIAKAETDRKLAEARKAEEEARKKLAVTVEAPRRVADEYADSTVLIESSWKLIDNASGKQVFHRYYVVPPKEQAAQGQAADGAAPGKGEAGKGGEPGKGQEPAKAAPAPQQEQLPPLPMYVLMGDGSIEPLVTTDDANRPNVPIGSSGNGSGFVVTENGFILTNKHVAAPWLIPYSLPFPGVLVRVDENGNLAMVKILRGPEGNLASWIPARAAILGGKNIEYKALEGRNDTLDVTFPKSKLRIPASQKPLPSPEHDVALIKIDVPTPLKKVVLWDNYDSIASGDPVVLLGYPGIMPGTYTVTRSKEMGNAGAVDIRSVPDVTVNQGIISKVLRSGQAKDPIMGDLLLSPSGDVYAVSISTTGPGNSGGPLFSPDGRVIGIHTYGKNDPRSGARMSFATPIRFGQALINGLQQQAGAKK